MKKFYLLILSFFLLPILLVTPILAQENIKQSDVVTLAKDQVINSDYFGTGETVIISGTVNGDVYAFGGKIIVDGVVNGDLIAAGGTVDINGRVEQDARIGGGQISINGPIGRNLTVGGGSINLSQSSKIGGSLVAGGGSLNISAPITKGATIGGGSINLANSIGGDVNIGADQILLTSPTKINGNLNYWSSENINTQPEASVSGKITHNYPQKNDFNKVETKKAAEGFGIAAKIFNILTSLVLGLLLINLLPVFTRRVVDQIAQKPLNSFLVGFISFFVVPILFIILLLTLVGIPLAFILLFAFIVDVYIAKIFISVWVGEKIGSLTNRTFNLNWAFVIGLIVYVLFTSIPVVGWLVSFIAVPIGIGALIYTKFGFIRELREKKQI